METFEQKVERFMNCDKRTLAEMLAMQEMIMENKNTQPLNPEYYPYRNDLGPNVVRPSRTVPDFPPKNGDWVITCSINN